MSTATSPMPEVPKAAAKADSRSNPSSRLDSSKAMEKSPVFRNIRSIISASGPCCSGRVNNMDEGRQSKFDVDCSIFRSSAINRMHALCFAGRTSHFIDCHRPITSDFLIRVECPMALCATLDSIIFATCAWPRVLSSFVSPVLRLAPKSHISTRSILPRRQGHARETCRC